jgi:hypothetical protein
MSYEPNICLYHADCSDGFGAAWSIWRRFPSCTFIPAAYGEPLDLDDIEGKNVLFVDFSAPAETLRAMVDEGNAKRVIVLDHHKSAQAALAGLPTFYGDYPIGSDHWWESAKVVVYFDMEKSGARLAWEFAYGDEPLPDMLMHIEDNDLWLFKHYATKQFIAALRSYPQDFQTWDWINTHVEALIEDGPPILRAHYATVQKICDQWYDGDLAGHAIPMVNCPRQFASDVGHELLKRFPGVPFAASWYRRNDGLLEFSLRSEAHRLDVSEVAALFGGGGHRNAAGFQLAIVEHGHSVGAV